MAYGAAGIPFTQILITQSIKQGDGVVDRYRPGSKYQLIADAMVRNNDIPTFEKVAARHQSRKEARLRRNAPSAPVDLTHSIVDTLKAMIAQSWKDHGRGPYWGEVAAAMGWDHAQTRDVMFRLRTTSAVAFTTERGSLRLVHSETPGQPKKEPIARSNY
jgi:hypothetical protein